MKDEKEFYIGYMPNAPKSFSSRNKVVVIFILVLIPIVTFLLVSGQKGFPNSQFEFGNLVELEGVLFKEPIPILKVKTGEDAFGKDIYQSIMLINFLKYGADELLKGYEEKISNPLNQTKVKVKGTLIYYNGVTLLELTDQENALIDYGPIDGPALSQTNNVLGNAELSGEIVDPKCFFGVMKPGEGKPHKSCAIRCIAGGIPPVLMVKNDQGHANYIILKGANGEYINQQILPYVANPIKLSGNLMKVDDWLVMETSEDQWVSLPDNSSTDDFYTDHQHDGMASICIR
ncbi:MAG: hypothetical protein AAFN93_10915 [Bacteroidota bacterium]